MVFTRKVGRPRKHVTVKEGREVTRLRKAAWEAEHMAARSERRRARSTENAHWLTRTLSWSGVDCTVNKMFEDTCFDYPLPTDTRLGTLFRQLKNLYLHIDHAFDDAPSRWFADTADVLLRSRGTVLQDHISFLQSVLRCLQPYFHAMDITHDTFGIFFSKEDVWVREAAQMAERVHAWADNLHTILDAWDAGTLKEILPLVTTV
ncbi:hypothetical protein CYLTODRAFT_494560 [Cylindrobasidium torrendii FP15055 ss-10]|uniref:Uncharacterized protein n=1 Tax=Cylindrobasidium torrendii FP15055 ss-10 TaxID=1314674 RepID=A0A0D7AZ38_9AGAR|nr:hypothetical protein CYLTODRAFT_494560 [Cylindrobasidium torrendii FP15055 ss-10]